MTEAIHNCWACGQVTFPLIGAHYCIPKVNKGSEMGLLKKWDHQMRCWVVREVIEKEKTKDSKPSSYKWYDSTRNAWVETIIYPKGYSGPPVEHKIGEGGGVKEYTIASCAVPERKVSSGSPGGNYSYYNPVYPWEGLDREKWPNTWKHLLVEYFKSGWHSGKYITDEEYKNRVLNKVYAPEPKVVNHYPDYEGYGYYRD